MYSTFRYWLIWLLCPFSLAIHAEPRPGGLAADLNPGSLEVLQIGGAKPETRLELPLRHTEARIEVSGFVARATVVQHYQNPYDRPIEAVYTFPLPEDAAVDAMEMTIGQRTIKGRIERREEARRIYQQARDQGQRASLLEQERPNVFTQSVANIMPGDDIRVTIRYVDILSYGEGHYELVFPMVVGPRYIPGESGIGHGGTGWSMDTEVVPDASRITPPVLKPGERSGHDIALSVELDAGVPIQRLHSPSHRIESTEISPNRQKILLSAQDTLPNKDFILRYEVAGEAPQMAALAHHDERGGFFTLMIQPQREVTDDQVIKRELIFIVDTSGSMSGFPIEKSKEAMRKLIAGMRPDDLFNVVRFAGDTGTLWKVSRPATPANIRMAMQYVEGFQGGGGTEMRQGIMEALGQPAPEGALRLAFLLTDGYVGNEMQILETIEQTRRGARIFSLGVGSSVNRYLLDSAAEVGRGEAFYLRQDEDSSAVIDKFFQRVDKPALGYIEIDWNGLAVEQLYPRQIPDLWAGQPILLHGRYPRGGEAEITVRGQMGSRDYRQSVYVALPENQPENAALASVWARKKVHELMNEMVRQGQTDELIQAATQTGLDFQLMTQWTSFVAVEEKIVNRDGKPETVVQPVELPEGVDYEGVFGETEQAPQLLKMDMGAMRGMAPTGMGIAPMMAEPVPVPANGSAESKAAPPRPMKREIIATLSDNIVNFAAGGDRLTADSKKLLDNVAIYVVKNLALITEIVLAGHSDSNGTTAANLAMSRKRAEAVLEYLVKKGVPREKIRIEAHGDSQPIDSNQSKAGRAKNRRVEVNIIFAK
jgi:Ca-activated chloride channel family protein